MNIGIEDLRYIEERVISFKNLIEEKISFINGYLDDIECVEDLEFVNLKSINTILYLQNIVLY